MPLQATAGAASYDAFGGGVAAVPNYIEDVFSTWLFTQSSTGAIPNGIDLAGKGGMVWQKARTLDDSHNLMDTVRGTSSALASNTTQAAFGGTSYITSFNSNGFTTGSYFLNYPVASWTFREQPKFFDVVTYTGNGSSTSFNVAHNLGSTPGTIIVKRTNGTSNWAVAAYDGTNWRVGTTTTPFALNLTNASTFAVGSVATSTTFNVCRMQWTSGGNPTDDFNDPAGTYVAYLFAHNAGGFGLTGTDNVISCGSFTQPSSGDATITLGYEPQWVLIKRSDSVSGWFMYDTMRGMSLTNDAELLANTSGAEGLLGGGYIYPTATGFVSASGNLSAGTYIYIAIRRGPMAAPTTGTSVFGPQVQTPTGSAGYVMAGSSGFPVDWLITKQQTQNNGPFTTSRLTNNFLRTSSTAAEGAATYGFDLMQGVSAAWDAQSTVSYAFRRAPSAFDVVCYNGNSSTQTVPHNLTVVPELMIVKIRNGVSGWPVYSSAVGNTKFVRLNTTSAEAVDNLWANTTPTASSFTVGNNGDVNQTGGTYVAYLFASCPGVSKVGSYTGTGTTQTINCGFTGGARFVMIKRTDSTGDWYVWDTARGIVSGNDPYLLLNSTDAEVTNTDFVDTYSAGFEISSTAPSAINASGGTFIFLAIA